MSCGKCDEVYAGQSNHYLVEQTRNYAYDIKSGKAYRIIETLKRPSYNFNSKHWSSTINDRSSDAH